MAADVMSRETFKLLKSHWAWGPRVKGGSAQEAAGTSIFKLAAVYEYAQNAFLSVVEYCPRLSVDEKMVPYKGGKCVAKQRIKSKSTQFGPKWFLLCGALTGYTIFFIIYSGRDTL